MTADDIENDLYDAYGSRQVSSIYTPTDDYQVILELLPKYQLDPNVPSAPAMVTVAAMGLPL